jgi:hypothetical protein
MQWQYIIEHWARFWLPRIALWMVGIQKFLLLGLVIGMQISGKRNFSIFVCSLVLALHGILGVLRILQSWHDVSYVFRTDSQLK